MALRQGNTKYDVLRRIEENLIKKNVEWEKQNEMSARMVELRADEISKNWLRFESAMEEKSRLRADVAIEQAIKIKPFWGGKRWVIKTAIELLDESDSIALAVYGTLKKRFVTEKPQEQEPDEKATGNEKSTE